MSTLYLLRTMTNYRQCASRQAIKWLSMARRNELLRKAVFIFAVLVLATTCYMELQYVSFIIQESYDPYSIVRKDPYAILGIEHEDRYAANFTKVIKKAYRRLAVKYHPEDAWLDEQAERQFMQIGYAYEILTDPESRENFERYGHPHGPASSRLWGAYECTDNLERVLHCYLYQLTRHFLSILFKVTAIAIAIQIAVSSFRAVASKQGWSCWSDITWLQSLLRRTRTAGTVLMGWIASIKKTVVERYGCNHGGVVQQEKDNTTEIDAADRKAYVWVEKSPNKSE